MGEVWKAMSDKSRRQILILLKERPHSAGEIAERFSLSNATVSHHLSVLKDCELVVSKRQAQTIIYSLNTTVVQDMIITLKELFS